MAAPVLVPDPPPADWDEGEHMTLGPAADWDEGEHMTMASDPLPSADAIRAGYAMAQGAASASPRPSSGARYFRRSDDVPVTPGTTEAPAGPSPLEKYDPRLAAVTAELAPGIQAPPPAGTDTGMTMAPGGPPAAAGRPRLYGGPAPYRPPAGTFGGHYYGPEYEQSRLDRLNELAGMELRDEGNPREIAAERARILRELEEANKHGYTSEGIGHDIMRGRSAAEQQRGEYALRQAEQDERATVHANAVQNRLARDEMMWERARQQRQRDYQEGHTKMAEGLARAQEEVAKAEIIGDRRTAGEKALGAIGAALGALGAAWAKTPNFALQMIQHRLDADLDAQKANLANKRASLGDKRQMMAIYKEHFQDNELAALAARRDLYRQAQRRMQSMSGKVGLAKNEEARQQIELELGRQADESEKLLMHQGASAHEMEQAMRRQAAAAAAAARAKAERARVTATPDELKRYIPGWGVALPSTKEGTIDDLRAGAAANKTFNQNWMRYRQLAMKGNAATMDERAEREAIRAEVLVPTIKEYAGASGTDAEVERILPLLSKDPNSLSDQAMYDVVKSVDQFAERSNRKFGNRMEAQGVDPAQVSGPVFDEEKGERVRVIQYGERAPTGTGGARLQTGVAPE